MQACGSVFLRCSHARVHTPTHTDNTRAQAAPGRLQGPSPRESPGREGHWAPAGSAVGSAGADGGEWPVHRLDEELDRDSAPGQDINTAVPARLQDRAPWPHLTEEAGRRGGPASLEGPESQAAASVCTTRSHPGPPRATRGKAHAEPAPSERDRSTDPGTHRCTDRREQRTQTQPAQEDALS